MRAMTPLRFFDQIGLTFITMKHDKKIVFSLFSLSTVCVHCLRNIQNIRILLWESKVSDKINGCFWMKITNRRNVLWIIFGHSEDTWSHVLVYILLYRFRRIWNMFFFVLAFNTWIIKRKYGNVAARKYLLLMNHYKSWLFLWYSQNGPVGVATRSSSLILTFFTSVSYACFFFSWKTQRILSLPDGVHLREPRKGKKFNKRNFRHVSYINDEILKQTNEKSIRVFDRNKGKTL